MTWGYIGAAAVGVVGNYVINKENNKAKEEAMEDSMGMPMSMGGGGYGNDPSSLTRTSQQQNQQYANQALDAPINQYGQGASPTDDFGQAALINALRGG